MLARGRDVLCALRLHLSQRGRLGVADSGSRLSGSSSSSRARWPESRGPILATIAGARRHHSRRPAYPHAQERLPRRMEGQEEAGGLPTECGFILGGTGVSGVGEKLSYGGSRSTLGNGMASTVLGRADGGTNEEGDTLLRSDLSGGRPWPLLPR